MDPRIRPSVVSTVRVRAIEAAWTIVGNAAAPAMNVDIGLSEEARVARQAVL
jgi:hypothetical protein